MCSKSFQKQWNGTTGNGVFPADRRRALSVAVMARQLMKWCSTAKMLFMSYTRLSRAFLQMCLETIAPLIQIASKIFTMAVFRSEPVGIA